LADANTYRFSSQEYHQPSGLSLYLYRAYDPNLQRWLNRDPIEELGGNNLYAYVANEPISWVDRNGLDIVINNTGSPIMASGNSGAGHGSGAQLFGVIPPDGKPHGGTANPMLMYPSRDEAEIAAGIGGKQGPVRPAMPVTDIDFYDDPTHPWMPHYTDQCDSKLPGDELGPTTTLRKSAKGYIYESKDGVLDSYRRYIIRRITE
jgi:RHS repeat-associated protein